MKKRGFVCASLIAMAGAQAVGAPRDVQIVNIFPESQVFMIFNSGTQPVALDGWRLCSHNTTQVFRYSIPSGFNGVTLEPQSALTIHLNNDADPNNPMQFNASDLGSFASFELDAYSVSLYHPNTNGFVVFSDGNLMADHIQWSLGGLDNTTADERSDEAQNGGVWTDQSAWINVQSNAVLIELNDPTFAVLHGPNDYNVILSCPADLTGDGVLNFFDVSAFLGAFAAMDPIADFTGDGVFNFFDVSAFLGAFSAGCP